MTPKTTEIAICAGISVLCGFAQFTQGVREGRNQKTFFEFAADMSSSLVAGAIAYVTGVTQNLDVYVIYFMVLVAANNAQEVKAKALEQFSNLFSLFKGKK